ncbi:hypothetical protein [Campylobacter concisus]|uniref:hypothetical protein n=1 Tax=Campylobacter concisus TaxID=199 RepID=UPI000CD97529|nr:hypothetical protein [Campylobacter concisus]
MLERKSAEKETKQGGSYKNEEKIDGSIQRECENIKIKGVKSIGVHEDEPKEVQKSFELTYKIYESLKPKVATICSMGMSSDYELAIKCGSNMIRFVTLLYL